MPKFFNIDKQGKNLKAIIKEACDQYDHYLSGRINRKSAFLIDYGDVEKRVKVGGGSIATDFKVEETLIDIDTLQEKRKIVQDIKNALTDNDLDSQVYQAVLGIIRENQVILHAHSHGPAKDWLETIKRALAMVCRFIIRQDTHAEEFEKLMRNPV